MNKKRITAVDMSTISLCCNVCSVRQRKWNGGGGEGGGGHITL